MAMLPSWASRINMDTELPRAIQLVLGNPDAVARRATAGSPVWWRVRRVATATAFGALGSSGPPLLTLANIPSVLTMTVRQASQLTWGIGAQVAKANGYAASVFIDPAADLVGVLALWAKVTFEHVRQAVLWTLPKIGQVVRIAASTPAGSLAAEWLRMIGQKARSQLNTELLRQIFSYQVGGLRVATMAIGGVGSFAFVQSIGSSARKYYDAKLELQST